MQLMHRFRSRATAEQRATDRQTKARLKREQKLARRRRQLWGTADYYGGLPVVTKPAGRAVVSGARFALFFTAVAWVVYLVEQIVRANRVQLTARTLAETILYLVLVTLLTGSAAAYLLARLGYFERLRQHHRVPRSTIDAWFDRHEPTLTVLVPSYREEVRIVRLTLLSAALQEYPQMRIVLLVDDPPNPVEAEFRAKLEAMRALIAALNRELAVPHRQFAQALADFMAEPDDNPVADSATLARLTVQYDAAAAWFAHERASLTLSDHIDHFFAIEVLDRLRVDLKSTAEAIRAMQVEGVTSISRRRVQQLYLRLVRIFQAEFTSFERKQFVSLSHEPNKAMNLNSYIGLMGDSYNVVSSPSGPVLITSDGRVPDLVVPDSEYLLTLDADSILLPEYCLRLVYLMEQPENGDVAIAQTPYSAYRGSLSKIERIAGATTDIQHIVHLGLTRYSATFWVGANAIIRKRLLNAMRVTEDEAGFPIQRFVSDRTVIEDTESSIDVRAHGWRMINYPERLSYSATPPDFGALVIQRRRWSNGGLVILPKLLRLFVKRKNRKVRIGLAELFLRVSYLASISWATVSLLLLLFYPFEDQLLTRTTVLIALPYWWAMAGDLRRTGYRRRDIFLVYGFNLLILPVSLTGTIQSIVQTIGGQRTAFARTPKVNDRTVVPLAYLVLPLVLIGWSIWALQNDIVRATYIHGAFAAVNLLTMFYALIILIGLRDTIVDIAVNLREFVYRSPAAAPAAPPPVPHWAAVLYVGGAVPEEIDAGAPLAAALAARDLFSGRSRADEPGVPAAVATVNGNGSNGTHYANAFHDDYAPAAERTLFRPPTGSAPTIGGEG